MNKLFIFICFMVLFIPILTETSVVNSQGNNSNIRALILAFREAKQKQRDSIYRENWFHFQEQINFYEAQIESKLQEYDQAVKQNPSVFCLETLRVYDQYLSARLDFSPIYPPPTSSGISELEDELGKYGPLGTGIEDVESGEGLDKMEVYGNNMAKNDFLRMDKQEITIYCRRYGVEYKPQTPYSPM